MYSFFFLKEERIGHWKGSGNQKRDGKLTISEKKKRGGRMG
jgi:hypothetical protein